ncbi:serine/threonine protein kinase, partial [Mycolicibacterium elephantis]
EFRQAKDELAEVDRAQATTPATTAAPRPQPPPAPPPETSPTTTTTTAAPTTTAAAAPTVVIGADCSPVGATGTTEDGSTAYCSTLQSTGASIWSLTEGEVPSPTVTTAATDVPLPFAEESPVRVCMEQTGQTRRECRRDIRESNGLPPLP